MARKLGSTTGDKKDDTAKAWVRHDDKSHYVIQSVVNAFDLLELAAHAPHGLPIDTIRRKLGLSKDMTVRLAATLERRGYLEKDRLTEHFNLSLRTMELSQTFIRQAALFHQARPLIAELWQACEETVYIAMLRDNQCAYLDQLETRLPVRVVSRFASLLPAYCSAGGKAQLAYLPPDRLSEYLNGLEFVSYTPATIVDRKRLEEHLARIAAEGIAINHEELETGVCGVAAPIRNHTGKVIAAVVVSLPAFRMGEERLNGSLIPLVRETAARISAKLGYSCDREEEG